MDLSPEILNELKAISPLLASLQKINVFLVPEGYFNELHLRVANYAMLNDNSADNINKRTRQEVPQGYFDTLSDSILAKVKATYNEGAQEELQKLSPVLSSLKGNVFTVPDGYFESFAGKFVEKIGGQAADSESAEEELRKISPVLSSLKGNVFTVPDGYFESFAGKIAEKLKRNAVDFESAVEELGKLSPLLSSLKDNVFTVPAGYFESFAAGMIKKVKPEPAMIITMKKRNSWLKYAAAAVITGIIAAGSLLIFNNPSGISSDKAFAGLPAVQASFQYKTADDLNAGIAKLSDDDIIKYLEKNGNMLDNELLTNNTDVDEMPSQADYLNDENTLNTYLDKIDAEMVDKSKP